MPAPTWPVSLQQATVTLPDGSTPWRDLTLQLTDGLTGLVGQNGMGKSLLARVIVHALPPSQGEVHHAAPVAWLPQHPDTHRHPTVAELSGFGAVLQALARLAAGAGTADDLLCAEQHWDLPERLRQALEEAGVGHLTTTLPSHHLSGGEATRVMLAGLFLREDHYLVLDEPGNHLDQSGRDWLARRLRAHRPGALVISHDPTLLEHMTRILCLDSDGLHSHSGSYRSWRAARDQARDAALATLAHARKEKRQGERSLQAEHEKQQRRTAAGRRRGQDSNQASILLDRQKERSQSSAGAHQRQQDARRAALATQVRDAAARVTAMPEIHFLARHSAPAAGRRMVTLDHLQLPHGQTARRPLTLTLTGPVRIAVTGPNGTGKSTLLQLIHGHASPALPPAAGRCIAHVPTALLSQGNHLTAAGTALDALLAANPGLPEGEARMRLAQAGLASAVIQRPAARLSGGERLKAALVCALSHQPTPQLLLLDEPDNHIDPEALDAVEHLLRHWHGGLLVVSHSRRFLDALQLTGELALTHQGWHFTGQTS